MQPRGLCAAAVISHPAALNHTVAPEHVCVYAFDAGMNAWTRTGCNESLSVSVTDELVGLKEGHLFLSDTYIFMFNNIQ